MIKDVPQFFLYLLFVEAIYFCLIVLVAACIMLVGVRV